jgi:hypothetical protein
VREASIKAMSSPEATQERSEQSADGFARLCGGVVTDFGLVDRAPADLIHVDLVGVSFGASELEFSSPSAGARAEGPGRHG